MSKQFESYLWCSFFSFSLSAMVLVTVLSIQCALSSTQPFLLYVYNCFTVIFVPNLGLCFWISAVQRISTVICGTDITAFFWRNSHTAMLSTASHSTPRTPRFLSPLATTTRSRSGGRRIERRRSEVVINYEIWKQRLATCEPWHIFSLNRVLSFAVVQLFKVSRWTLLLFDIQQMTSTNDRTHSSAAGLREFAEPS